MSSTGAQAWSLGRLRERAQAEATTAGEAITFPELVWAHFLYQRELKEKQDLHSSSEAEYRERLTAFVRENGELVNAYWCSSDASGVALTEKPRSRVLGLWRRLPEIRFHAATDWITKDAADAAHTLHTCETLAIRVGEVLAGTSERIAMQWILSVAGYVLGVVDQSSGKPSRQELAVANRRARLELQKIEAYYDRAGERSSRLVYFWGMMAGVATLIALALAVVGVVALFHSFHPHRPHTQELFAVYAMGAIGALVSVMTRMASASGRSFTLDYEVGRRSIRRVGSFRPCIGAIFALVLYFALRGDLLQITPTSGTPSIYFYAALAFLAGFSERWARVMLGSAEKVLGDPGDHPPPGHDAPDDRSHRSPARGDEADSTV
jgi:uncharacterized membrane protein